MINGGSGVWPPETRGAEPVGVSVRRRHGHILSDQTTFLERAGFEERQTLLHVMEDVHEVRKAQIVW